MLGIISSSQTRFNNIGTIKCSHILDNKSLITIVYYIWVEFLHCLLATHTLINPDISSGPDKLFITWLDAKIVHSCLGIISFFIFTPFN